MEPLKKIHKAVEAPSASRDIVDKIDRISHLPDDVLYHILSFLDVFDAVGAGLLSKRWERLCSALRFLDIDIPTLCNQRNLRLNSELCYKFQNFISWVLTSRSGIDIVRLRLICHVTGVIFTGQQVFRWMCVAAKQNVQELIIMCDPTDVFHIPFSLVRGQSLQILELHLSGRVLQLPNYPGFLHLKSLCLKNIKLTDEYLTRTFFSGCPVLNKLVLTNCTFENINVLHISSVSIEHLLFEDGHESGGYGRIDLKISCPNLLAFQYGAPVPRRYIFESVASLETMHIHPWICETVSVKEIASCVYVVLKMEHKIVDLKLGFFILMGLYEMGDEFKFTCCSFHGLKVLNVWLTLWEFYVRFLSLLLEHSPNIEALTIYPSEKLEYHIMPKMEDFSKITCLRSTVKTIRLIDFKGEDDEIDLARNLLKAGLVLKKFVVYWSTDGVMDEEIVKRILSFHRSSASVEIVFVEPHLSMDFDGWLLSM